MRECDPMENLTDTVLNVFVFVFIGILIWLYFMETPQDKGTKR